MTTRLLTVHTASRLRVGDDVKFKGHPFTVQILQPGDFILLKDVEVKLHYVCVKWNELLEYTLLIKLSNAEFAAQLTEHNKLVRSRAYTSVYFPPAIQTPYDL